jgi:hypothetical protein
LRLDKAGQGEGKLSAGGGIALAPKDSSLIVRDFEKQRAILTAVRRE